MYTIKLRWILSFSELYLVLVYLCQSFRNVPYQYDPGVFAKAVGTKVGACSTSMPIKGTSSMTQENPPRGQGQG